MNLWQGLARIGAGGGVLADWQAALGEHMEFGSAYRLPTGQIADSVPCPAQPGCGCRHEVIDCGDEIVARCRCDAEAFGRCEPQSLTREQTEVLALDDGKLCADVARTLGFAGRGRTLATGSLLAPGCFGAGRHDPLQAPVILYLPGPLTNQAAEVARLAIQLSGPFLLLTMSRGPWRQELEPLLHSRGCAWLVLEECLAPKQGGGFEVLTSIEPVWREWEERTAPAGKSREALRLLRREIAAFASTKAGPEPCSDTAAAQAFALIKKLDTGTRWKKAHPMQVCQLYCNEALSASEIAQRCGCSKTLVIRRLKLIRQIIGRDPASLRSVSSHFETMEDSLRDSRARHIRPRAVIEQEEDEEE